MVVFLEERGGEEGIQSSGLGDGFGAYVFAIGRARVSKGLVFWRESIM